MVLQWDTLKAGLVLCPVQRDGGAEGGHVSDNRRVGSGCNGQEKCIITLKMHVFEHHMYIGDEGRAIYVYTVTCMHCRYTYGPSAHASTLYNISAKSKHTVVLHQLQNTWQNTAVCSHPIGCQPAPGNSCKPHQCLQRKCQ